MCGWYSLASGVPRFLSFAPFSSVVAQHKYWSHYTSQTIVAYAAYYPIRIPMSYKPRTYEATNYEWGNMARICTSI